MPDIAKVHSGYVVEILIKFPVLHVDDRGGSKCQSVAFNEADLTPIAARVPRQPADVTLAFVHTFHLSTRVPQKYSECRAESDTKRDYSRTWHLFPGSS